MTAAMSLTMTSRDSPDRLTDAVRAFVRSHNVPQRPAYLLDLVLEEIITNVIKYGAGDRVATIAVDLLHEGQRIFGTVRDDAAPFDPLSLAPVDVTAHIDNRAVGGLGIHLVREMTDALAYRREDGHNVMTFSIDLTKETP